MMNMKFSQTSLSPSDNVEQTCMKSVGISHMYATWQSDRGSVLFAAQCISNT